MLCPLNMPAVTALIFGRVSERVSQKKREEKNLVLLSTRIKILCFMYGLFQNDIGKSENRTLYRPEEKKQIRCNGVKLFFDTLNTFSSCENT